MPLIIYNIFYPNIRIDMKWILLVVALGVLSCRSVRYVPVKTETIENDSILRSDSVDTNKEISRRDSSSVTERVEKSDSVVIRDSSVTIVDIQGNVLKTERYREKESYNTKELQRKEFQYRELESKYKELQSKYEALLNEKQKKAEVPYPVEKPLSWWQNVKLQAGGFALSLIVIFVLMVVVRMVRKLRG